MFDIGWGELVVIGVVALIVIGPKELPALLRTLGQGMAKLRAMASDFQHQFNDAMREAEIEDLRKEAEKLTDMASIATDPIAKIGDDLQKAIDSPIDTPAADAANPLAAATPIEQAPPPVEPMPLPDPAPQPVEEATVQKRAEGGGA
jgi:sec-independent protein translocase protein TatB